MDWIVLDEKIVKIVYVFFYFAITFSSEIQVLNFIWTNLDSFFRKITLCKFWMILPNRYENSPFAQFYTNSFAFVRESYACISECFAQYIFFSTEMSSMAFRRNVFWNCKKKRSLTSFRMVAHYIWGFIKVRLNSSFIFSSSVLTVSRKNC